jgi:hypothetical protein
MGDRRDRGVDHAAHAPAARALDEAGGERLEIDAAVVGEPQPVAIDLEPRPPSRHLGGTDLRRAQAVTRRAIEQRRWRAREQDRTAIVDQRSRREPRRRRAQPARPGGGQRGPGVVLGEGAAHRGVVARRVGHQPRLALQHHDPVGAGVGQRPRRGQPGEAAADDGVASPGRQIVHVAALPQTIGDGNARR